jgi:hypothetical protein
MVVCGVLQVRLFEEEPSYCSYGEAYDINCARFGREPDMPIAHFKKRLAAPDGNYDKVRGRGASCGSSGKTTCTK